MIENIVDFEPNAELRRCYDCRHMMAAVNWWCMNPQAVEARGTAIPGVCQCQHWAPAKRAKWYHRLDPFQPIAKTP